MEEHFGQAANLEKESELLPINFLASETVCGKSFPNSLIVPSWKQDETSLINALIKENRTFIPASDTRKSICQVKRNITETVTIDEVA